MRSLAKILKKLRYGGGDFRRGRARVRDEVGEGGAADGCVPDVIEREGTIASTWAKASLGLWACRGEGCGLGSTGAGRASWAIEPKERGERFLFSSFPFLDFPKPSSKPF